MEKSLRFVTLCYCTIQMTRRTLGTGGNIVWERLKNDESFGLLIDTIWEYQFTKKKTPLTEEVINLLYEEYQGIIDIAVKIYAMAQIKAISTGKEELALEMLKGNDGRGVHSIVGAAQVSVKQQGYFKICPICYKEGIQDYGEAYLHKIHQIPEVFICSKHQVPLKISTQQIYYYGKNAYVSLLEVEFKDNIRNSLLINNLEHF